MAEVFGAVAAGIPIGSELIRLGRYIQKTIERIKNSRKDVEELATETIIFASIYKRFLRDCDDDRDANTTDASAIQSLVSWAQGTLKSLTKLLRKVEALYPQSKSRSKFEDRAIARVVWLGSTGTVKALRDSLSVARESISGFSHLMCLDKLKDQMRVLKEALHNRNNRRKLEDQLGVTLEDKIRELDQEIFDAMIVHQEHRKTLIKAQIKVDKHQGSNKTADLTPATEELAHFTQALDHYAGELLSQRRLSKRADSYHSASSASSSGSVSSLPSHRSQPAVRPDPITTSGSSRVNKSSTTTSPARSSVSVRSSEPTAAVSSSSSTASSRSRSVPKVDLPLKSGAGVTVERQDLRSREYINDPTGNILSPPILKTRDPPAPRTKTVRIGDHVITLEATQLEINHHSLHVNDYANGLNFFETLQEHPNELDGLNEAIGRQDEDWEGIPGWVVSPSEFTVQAAASGVRDV